MRILFVVLLAVAAVVLSMPRPVLADEAVDELLRKVQFHREQLHSGEYQISVDFKGKLILDDGTVEESEHTWTGDCVFDALNELYLMRYRITGDFWRIASPVDEDPMVRLEQQPFISAVDGDAFLFFDPIRGPPTVLRIDNLGESTIHGYKRLPMDPRGIGMHSGFRDLYEGDRLDQALGYVSKTRPHIIMPQQVVPTNALLCLSRIRGRNTHWKTDVCFDPSRDYVVVSSHDAWGLTDPETLEFTPSKVRYDAKIDWEERDGVYVPTTFVEEFSLRTVRTRGEKDDLDTWEFETTERTVTANLTWQSVNQPVDPAQFDYHTFGLPAKTLVSDSRGDVPRIIERIEGPPVRSDGVELDLQSSFVMRFTAATVAVLVMLSIWFWGRQRLAKAKLGSD